MKNKDTIFRDYYLRKKKQNIQFIRTMKLTTLFLTACIYTVCAENSFSQNAKVNIHRKDVKIESILNEIEKQTDYLFIYNDKVPTSETASVNASGKSVMQVLDGLFKNTDIQYTVEGSHIILHSSNNTKNSNASHANRGISNSTDDRTISGTVVDDKGEPLIGVSITVKGTTIGTTTDMDGNFSLKAAEGQTLEISYLGFTTQQKAISGQNSSFNIVLSEDNVALDEIVVTALGIKRAQKALSYNVQEIKGDQLTGVKDVNFMNSLSGKVAGVNINSSAAGIGGATRVVMRGTKSITKDNNALYVIDGVPIFNANNGGLNQNDEFADQPRGEGISDINPEDIESMTVLTGPAAAALYGSNAANGAIVITTKKGIEGKPKVSISNQTTFSRPFIMPDFQNKYGNRPGEYRSWGEAQNQYSFEPKDFFDTGLVNQFTASLSTGSKNNQTYMSLGSSSASGIIPNNEYNKYNITLRNTTQFLNDKMTLDFGFSYIKQKDKNMIAQGRYYNPLTSVYTFPRGENFDNVKNYQTFDEVERMNTQNWTWGDQGIDMQNPYWILNRNQSSNKKNRYMMNVNLKYDLTDGINLVGRARLDNSVNDFTRKNYATTTPTLASSQGSYTFHKEDYRQVYADFLVNINKYWGDYSFASNIGTSISDMRSSQTGAGGGLMIPNFFALTNIDKKDPKAKYVEDGWHEQTQSIFANVEIGWKNRLYMTLTGRNDWASALANTKHSSFFYPSIGFSGVISEMVKLPKAVSYLKARGSYSSVGSPIPRNLSIATYPFDSQSGYWETNTYKPIDDLKPEKTNSWEFGISSKFWNNRLSFDMTWYKSNTKNQTLNIPISVTSGYSSMYVQTGNVENQGIEMTLGADNTWGAFSWNSTFTASNNKNEIKQLIEEGKFFDPSGAPITLDAVTQGKLGSAEFRLTKGGTMGDLWTKTKLKRNEDGTLALSANGRPILENTMEKAGSVLPKWNLGFRNDFGYKGVSLGIHVSARLGGIVMSPTQAILDGFGVTEATATARDRGGIPNGNSTINAEDYYTVTGQTNGLLSDYVYKATNVRLQELSVGYHIPKQWINNIAKVHVSLVARNLWMIYNKAPFDPEATASTGTYFQGIDYFMQPSQRSIGFNIRAEF